jgi:hypothetical protein
MTYLTYKQKELTNDNNAIVVCQKRPKIVSKETYGMTT